MSDLKKLTGLWPNRSGNGYGVKLKADLTLKAGDRLLLFKIPEQDRRENGPTIELLLAQAEPQSGQRPDQPRRGGVDPDQARRAIDAHAPNNPKREFDDDVPF